MPEDFALTQLDLADMDAAAHVHRVALDERLPWLAGLYTPEEDRWFFRERVLPACAVWGALRGGQIVGFVAFRQGWIDHLYVLPDAQRQGVGAALLRIACSALPRLSLWTFQRNHAAREFYEAKGFVAVRQTDGSDNAEHEPDVLYTWSRPSDD
jgi:putative acetyltransferase